MSRFNKICIWLGWLIASLALLVELAQSSIAAALITAGVMLIGIGFISAHFDKHQGNITLSKDEYMIKGDSIILPKKTLERLRDYYDRLVDYHPFQLDNNTGRRDVFVELLKLFGDESKDNG